jgi:transposase-like protein
MIKVKSQITYSKEFKENMVQRMMPPENISPKDLAEISGVSRTSLSNWLKEAKSIEKKEVEWIPMNIPNEVTDNIVEATQINESIKVNIGKLSIEVETGFNKDLLLELLKVVDKL